MTPDDIALSVQPDDLLAAESKAWRSALMTQICEKVETLLAQIPPGTEYVGTDLHATPGFMDNSYFLKIIVKLRVSNEAVLDWKGSQR
jgi:hypothetical protein